MTHTKDTREAIARVIREYAYNAQTDDFGEEDPEKMADAILTALESAPQAGGDVRDAFPPNDWLPMSYYNYTDWGPWLKHDGGDCPEWVEKAVTGPGGDPVIYLTESGSGIGRNHAPDWPKIEFYRMRTEHPKYREIAHAALTATPAQPTPSGEVDGLVAEIDALFEKATQGKWEVQTGCSWRRIGAGGGDGNVLCPTNSRTDNHPDLTTGKGEDLYANLELICALVNAWPRIRTALGGGWRDVADPPEPGQHVQLFQPGKAIVVGYMSEVIGHGWRTCPGDLKWKPTLWKPITPPQLEGET